MRDAGNKTMKDIYADIGQGRRLAAVVARRLLAHDDAQQAENNASPAAPLAPLIIRGSEGMAIQLAPCCRPIPGDPIIGSIRKGQGLLIHTHDCSVIRKARSNDPQKWIDVEWEPEAGKLFEVHIKVTAKNIRGILGRVATGISEAGSNIEHVTMDEKNPGLYTELRFVVQVSDRGHLAKLMRSVRRIQDVVRIGRERE
jgi:GTP pyrophosphokinase/guanosine-3',5'-bis(diphosphate) 3'-pyrophosphohydrolase